MWSLSFNKSDFSTEVTQYLVRIRYFTVIQAPAVEGLLPQCSKQVAMGTCSSSRCGQMHRGGASMVKLSMYKRPPWIYNQLPRKAKSTCIITSPVLHCFQTRLEASLMMEEAVSCKKRTDQQPQCQDSTAFVTCNTQILIEAIDQCMLTFAA